MGCVTLPRMPEVRTVAASTDDDTRSPAHAADRLLEAIAARRAPVCVGIDPVIDRLPRACQPAGDAPGEAARAIGRFAREVIAAVSPHVPCVKLQAACFERYRQEGWAQLTALLGGRERPAGMQVILDAKRGDIGVTAQHYAAAAFADGGRAADWLTINSYLGEDGMAPFLADSRRGAFALVRTSNPGGDQVQNLALQDGRTVAQAVGEMVARVGASHVGARGYSSLGAVVGATRPHDARRLREIMPQQMFLVPGYGAQGAGLDDILPCFKSDGLGAIVTASRSVIYAFKQDDPKWTDSVADAAARFAEEVGRAVGMR